MISAVRMKLTSAAQFQNSEVAGGRPVFANAVEYPNTAAGELSAKQALLPFFNIATSQNLSSLQFPYGRNATYSQFIQPSTNSVSVPLSSYNNSRCVCSYSATRSVAVGPSAVSEQWSAELDVCTATQKVRLVSYTVPLFNVEFFTQPDIGIERLTAQYAAGYGWFVYLNGATFDSGGNCQWTVLQSLAYDSASGGSSSGCSGQGDSRTVSIDKALASQVTFQVTQSVVASRFIWNNSPDPRYNTASRCPAGENMTSQYTVAIEVDFA
jgi:hypothetical protein